MDEGHDGEDAPPLPPGPLAADEGAELPQYEPPTLETAVTWLAQARPAAVLTLLRDPAFALTSMTAFAGFRVNATGYANPLVRRRLAQEAVRDEKFAEKLQALAEDAPPSSSQVSLLFLPTETENSSRQDAASAPHDASAPAAQVKDGEGEAKRLATLRADRDRRRRERDEARRALAEAEATRQESERRKHQAEAERDEASQQAQRQAQRIARLERLVGRLQAEQAGLQRALKRHESAAALENEGGVQTAVGRDAGEAKAADLGQNFWRDAVLHLLDKRRYDLALSLAEDVLRAAPDDPTALEIAARAQAARGDMRQAVSLYRRRLSVALARGARGEAGEALLRLLLLAPGEIERDLRTFLAGIRAEDTTDVDAARVVLGRLRGLDPETHTAAAAWIEKSVPATLAEALIPPPGRLEVDDPLPLGLPDSLSARHLLQAVDTGAVGLVGTAREALGRLCRTDPETQQRIRDALERAAGADSSVLIPLVGGRERGPVIVDGSNAAWYDQESLTAGHPRLRPLLELRRALRTRGYFPVLLYADAPLPYTIDDPDTLRGMVARGELTLVDSGVDADEVLLRKAKHYGAPLVTNDYMSDWDPNNEVRKIRYALSLHGEAYLLQE